MIIKEITAETKCDELSSCLYQVGITDKDELFYLWWECDADEALAIGDIIPEELISSPEALRGAMIDTKEEIVREIEDCVGSFRYWGDEVQKEAANEVVDILIGGLK